MFTFSLPFALALNVKVNDRDYIVPMVVEEPSVVAAASNAARMIRIGGGFMADGPQYVTDLMSLAEHTGELEALGVQLKDYERGLLDFPSMREGRVVLLCWQLGEGDRIEWWHDLETGFSGRQPI